jgi:uncharacterized protein
MTKQVIFFQGGGGVEDYDADAKMVASLRSTLGSTYSVHYPFLSNEEAPDFGRRKQIGHEISVSGEEVILVGHSLGASMLLAYLSENNVVKRIAGIFLIAAPFWSGDADWVKPLKLQPDFAERLNKKTPMFFYHCRDDKEVPFAHLAIYKQAIPWASFREIPVGGHHLDNNLEIVAADIRQVLPVSL